ncbi:ZYBA0S12-01640g1_1 [Zygosaccharomyces bailii CLIB 213]|uniref:Protein STU1 n=1 Tax=Zygosaccharomyces bailii (strain CLIB 213 / ATCC 58445 / CBS 680 / BCRC 21525 / NBRC 1098 / NCYC 1416 / NRRL Y-2227) TaxID=1333698 RepID=A0A8J2XAM8_ZYGB2|nr:ZYBA0S12-01640g1_1 [Zygosaccharomyces bailii CLIB 213]
MPDTFAVGFPLYEQLSQSGDNDPVLLLTQFKGHVKKELVDVPSIPNYFKGLLYVLDKPEFSNLPRISTLAHSSLSYLVKRVAMQSPAYFEDLNAIRNLVAHLFMLGKESNIQLEARSFWVSSSRALEAIYLIQPVALQNCLEELLKDNDAQLRKLLLVMQELLQISQKVEGDHSREAIFQRFVPLLVHILNQKEYEESEVASLVCDILIKNNTEKNQLQDIAERIGQPHNKVLFQKAAAVVISDGTRPSSFPDPPLLNTQSELQCIYDEFQVFTNHYSCSNVVQARELSEESMEYVQSLLETLLVPFQSLKETEQNWKMRQANLIEMRGLVQNKFVMEHQLEFLSCCRELHLMECVGRAALSLRTTLSTTACLAMKDFIQKFSLNLDSVLLEQMFESLRALLFSSKKISSTNAFNCLVIMLTSIDFHNKLFQNCFMLINQKSTLPKNCSAILLRIFIIKFHNTSKLESSIIYIEEWLKKGITDAQTSVREAMRKTFWYYYKCYPNSAKKFLNSQLSLQLKKAVELSIPHHLHIDYQPIVSNSTISSLSSSLSSSRRTSFGTKNFPSYAKPTQSSNAFLQRVANARSTSEYVLRENNVNTHVNNSSKRKISAPPQFAKRSLTTPTHSDIHHHTSGPTDQSPAKILLSSQGDDSNSTFLEQHNEPTENSVQIDLTDDISRNHSNSLIKKYVGYKVGDGKGNLETMYQYLESSSLIKIKDGLQLLQNTLLMDSSQVADSRGTLDFERLTPLVRHLTIKVPQELKPLLSIPKFCQSIPLTYLIEIFAINHLDFADELLETLSLETSLRTVCEIIAYLDSGDKNQENESSPTVSLHYMKYKQFIFNFCFKLVQKFLNNKSHDVAECHEALGECIEKLAQICGQEYDETLYYDTIHQVYVSNTPLFVEKIRHVPLVSTKLKICNELEARDKEGNFHREVIVSRQSLDGLDGDRFTDAYKEEVVDEGKFMEMTMVNPFNQMRAASGGSVVHHDHTLSKTVAEADNPSNKSDEEYDDINQKGLSEITKVVSIYQPAENVSKPDVSRKMIEEQDVEMSGVLQETSVNLSEIFGTSQEHETTVKFSKHPPNIINPATRPSSCELTDSASRDEDHDLARNVSIERDKSPVTPLTEHQSKELSNGINSIDIGKKHEVTVSREKKSICNLSAEILANAIKENDNNGDPNTIEFNLLELVPSDSLIYHEISQAVITTNDFQDFNQLFLHMRKAITRIESKSFTMKHLNYVIGSLILGIRQENMRHWLELENGYNELLDLSEKLFHSTDETQMVPVNLACKTIVLIESLVLTNNYLQNVTPISSSVFKKIWEDVILMLSKLPEYSSEIYCLLQELRDLLVFLDFFTKADVNRILRGLASEVNDATLGIKETFLMETLSIILSKSRIPLQKRLIFDIISVIQSYLEAKKTEWRYFSCKVLSQVLQHSEPFDNDNTGINQLFNGLSSGRQNILRRFSSR